VKKKSTGTLLRDVFQKTTLLGAVLLIISVVLYKAFTFVEFYTIARGTGRIVHSLRKYPCEGPGTLTEDYDSQETIAKSYDISRLKSVVLGPNQVVNSEFAVRSADDPNIPGAFTTIALNTVKADFAYSHSIFEPDNSYVRVILNDDAPDASATWMPELTDVVAGNPYLATFTYRSDAVLNVTVEEVNAAGESTYLSLGLTGGSSQWKTYHAYWMPGLGTVKARLYLALEKKGSADIERQTLQAIPPRPLSQPIISVNFDDGWESVASVGQKYFDKYDIKTTQYVVASYVDNEQAYMSKAQLKELQSKGHEIGAHSLKHCNMSKLSLQDMEYDTRISKEILTRNYGDIMSFAHPYGSFSEESLDVLGKSFTYLRSTTSGFNDYYFDPHNIKVQNVKLETTIEDVQRWVKHAVDNKQWLVLVYHKVDTADDFGISEENFDKQMALIKNSGAQVLTMHDAITSIQDQYQFTAPPY
jgi:peptidoglycan/xylan/chitin deacetylase (PgdA/CDA1 family)